MLTKLFTYIYYEPFIQANLAGNETVLTQNEHQYG